MATITFQGTTGQNAGKTFTAEEGTQEAKQYAEMGFKLIDTGGANLQTVNVNGVQQVSAGQTYPNIPVDSGTDKTISGNDSQTGNFTSANPNNSAYSDAIKKAVTDTQTQLTDIQNQQTAANDQQSRTDLEQAMTDQQGSSTSDRTSARDRAGVDAVKKQLDEYQNQMNVLQESLNLGKLQIEGKVIPMEFITGQQAVLERTAAAKISAVASRAALAQNQFQYAQQLADQYYQDSQRDRQTRIDNLKYLNDLHRQDIVRLDAKEQNLLDQKLKLELEAAKTETETKDKIVALMLNNPQAWQKAGVDFTMSYDDIVTKVAAQIPGVEANKQSSDLLNKSIAGLVDSYPDAGINYKDSLDTAKTKIITASKIYREKIRPPVSLSTQLKVSSTTPLFEGQTFVGDRIEYSDGTVKYRNAQGVDTGTVPPSTNFRTGNPVSNDMLSQFLQPTQPNLGAPTSGLQQTTVMIGPDGREYNVPNNQVDQFIKDGGKRK